MIVTIIVLGGLILLSRKDKANVAGADQNTIIAASTDNGNVADHVFGKKDSKVIFIEYGDFQCPYCGDAYAKVKSVTEDYKDKIAFVFRNYPLPTIHPNAKAAAAAAEAAGLQGKYWEMHDRLYELQSQWKSTTTDARTSQLVEYAQMIGVTDIDKFKTDMSSNNVNKKINFDLALGNKAKVTGTPTFFINGELVPQTVSSSIINGDGSELRKALDEALK